MTKSKFELFSTAKIENFFFDLSTFHFLYDLTANKTRELGVAESNLIMQYLLSLSLSLGLFPFLSRSRFVSLTHTLSLSFLNCFVDAALQLLLCGVLSSSITLISAEL